MIFAAEGCGVVFKSDLIKRDLAAQRLGRSSAKHVPTPRFLHSRSSYPGLDSFFSTINFPENPYLDTFMGPPCAGDVPNVRLSFLKTFRAAAHRGPGGGAGGKPREAAHPASPLDDQLAAHQDPDPEPLNFTCSSSRRGSVEGGASSSHARDRLLSPRASASRAWWSNGAHTRGQHSGARQQQQRGPPLPSPRPLPRTPRGGTGTGGGHPTPQRQCHTARRGAGGPAGGAPGPLGGPGAAPPGAIPRGAMVEDRRELVFVADGMALGRSYKEQRAAAFFRHAPPPPPPPDNAAAATPGPSSGGGVGAGNPLTAAHEGVKPAAAAAAAGAAGPMPTGEFEADPVAWQQFAVRCLMSGDGLAAAAALRALEASPSSFQTPRP